MFVMKILSSYLFKYSRFFRILVIRARQNSRCFQYFFTRLPVCRYLALLHFDQRPFGTISLTFNYTSGKTITTILQPKDTRSRLLQVLSSVSVMLIWLFKSKHFTNFPLLSVYFIRRCFPTQYCAMVLQASRVAVLVWVLLSQGGRRLGDETRSPRFVQCVMRSRTGTSALFALPVRIPEAKRCFRTNRKSIILFEFASREIYLICPQPLIFNIKQMKVTAVNVAKFYFCQN